MVEGGGKGEMGTVRVVVRRCIVLSYNGKSNVWKFKKGAIEQDQKGKVDLTTVYVLWGIITVDCNLRRRSIRPNSLMYSGWMRFSRTQNLLSCTDHQVYTTAASHPSSSAIAWSSSERFRYEGYLSNGQ
jgi:hypothetical protein